MHIYGQLIVSLSSTATSTAQVCQRITVSITSSIVTMGYFTTQTLLLTVVAVVIPFADAPQIAGAGAVGPGDFGLLKTLPKQQSSGLSTGLKYILDEEEAGYSTAIRGDDQRRNRVEQFSLSILFASNGVLMRVSTEEVFGDSVYPQSKEVVWQIELPESRRVVAFQSFELDRSSPCGDYISIHNENGDLHKFCAQEKLEDIVQPQITLWGKRSQ